MKQNNEPRKSTHIYGQLTFDSGVKITQWESIVFSIHGIGENGYPHAEKLDPYLTQCTKINSKWIRDTDVRPIDVKLQEESVGGKLLGIVSSAQ